MTKTDATGSSKKGLVIAIVALVAIVVLAAIAYNALAPGAASNGNLQPTASAPGNDDVGSQTPSTSNASESSDAAAQTVEAPDFAMETADGGEITLSQLRGAPVVLNFWASTCGPCQSEMPSFQSAFEREGDRVQFAMVDVVGFNGETVARAKEFIASNDYRFPVYFDTDGNATVPYGLSSIPRTFFIDAQGQVVATAAGALTEDILQQGLAMI